MGETLLSDSVPVYHKVLGSISRATHKKLKQTKMSLQLVPNTHTPWFSKYMQSRIKRVAELGISQRNNKSPRLQDSGRMFDGL